MEIDARNAADQGMERDDRIPARRFRQNEGNAMYRAFAHPSGMLGRFAAWSMGRKNREMNRAAVEALDPGPGQAVLEIGFGPGVGLGLLAGRVGPEGLVAGVDVSAQMVDRAARLDRKIPVRGGFRLKCAGAEAIPWPDMTFDRVLAVSNVQFWRPASRSFGEVLRVLRPGGRLVAAVHAEIPGKKRMTPGLFPEEIEVLLGMLEGAGFSGVEARSDSRTPFERFIVAACPDGTKA